MYLLHNVLHSNEPGILLLIGNWHLLLLHFPIALLITTGIAEILDYFRPNFLFDQTARFMLLASAFFVIPTVFFGLILSYSGTYPPTLLLLHQIFGSLTLIFTLYAAYLKLNGNRSWLYALILALGIFSVAITGYFGGLMSFGEQGLPF